MHSTAKCFFHAVKTVYSRFTYGRRTISYKNIILNYKKTVEKCRNILYNLNYNKGFVKNERDTKVFPCGDKKEVKNREENGNNHNKRPHYGRDPGFRFGLYDI